MVNDWNMIGWFEIPVEDMGRAKTFYEAVFEKKLENIPFENGEMCGFPMIEKADGAPGALVKGKFTKPSADGVIVYFHTIDLNVELARIEPAGGKVLLPRTSIGEHGFIAWFLDTEGNRLALHSRK